MKPSRAKYLGACCVVLAIAVIPGCASPAPSLANGFSSRDIGVVVMPSAVDAPLALAMLEANASLDGRLDATLGAPERRIVDMDVTSTSVVDQQFSWNGRVYDSYLNVRRTYRRGAQ